MAKKLRKIPKIKLKRLGRGFARDVKLAEKIGKKILKGSKKTKGRKR